MKYCTKCGKELFDEAVICPGCGCPTEQTQPINPFSPAAKPLINILSERLKINGIIWIVIAVLQIIIGFTGAVWVLIVGALNIVSALKDLKASKEVLENPRGIVGSFEPLTGPIITLIYNLVVGGVVGVVGSIYYFVALRGFVLNNKAEFLQIENTFMG